MRSPLATRVRAQLSLGLPSKQQELAPVQPDSQEAATTSPSCYPNANKGDNRCGAGHGTCTDFNGDNTFGLGMCCSHTGWCGNGDQYCDVAEYNSQTEYSYKNKLCASDLADLEAAEARHADAVPSECLQDASRVPGGDNKCGVGSGQTCTGSHDQGPCCSAGGWCGGEAGKTDSEYCDPYSMQHQYSHGANLCDDSTPEATSHQDADCLTMTEVAKAARACQKEGGANGGPLPMPAA